MKSLFRISSLLFSLFIHPNLFYTHKKHTVLHYMNVCNPQQTRNGDWYVLALLDLFIYELLFYWKHLTLPTVKEMKS